MPGMLPFCHAFTSNRYEAFWRVMPVKIYFFFFCSVSDDNHTQCSVDADGLRWTCSSRHSNFSCSVDASGDGISCLDRRHCPFAEESQQIHITVYVMTKQFLVESYPKHFYLSEIGEAHLRGMFPHPHTLSFRSCLHFHLTLCFTSTLDSKTRQGEDW